MSAGGHGGRVVDGDNWRHPEAADSKRPRFAPGFSDQFNDLNNALREAIDSVSDVQQAAIKDAWIRLGHDGMVDFLLDHFTAEVKKVATKRNALLVQFLELVRRANGNEIQLTFDMFLYTCTKSSICLTCTYTLTLAGCLH